jgi:tRNA A37 N6-isopentenylltransferase MiaA
MTLDELYEYCKNNEIILPENIKNKRYVVRSIEKNGIDVRKSDTPPDNCIIVGIATEKDVLRSRIESRTESFLNDGVIDEATILGEKYGWNSEAMKSNIYPLIHQYLEDKINIDEVKKKFITLDWRLAKRHLTWLRRNSFIQWLSFDDAKKYLTRALAIRIQS